MLYDGPGFNLYSINACGFAPENCSLVVLFGGLTTQVQQSSCGQKKIDIGSKDRFRWEKSLNSLQCVKQYCGLGEEKMSRSPSKRNRELGGGDSCL